MKQPMIRIVLSCLSLIVVSLEEARSQNFVAKIDSLFLCYSAEKPGGQLAVSKNGKVIYSKAWGIADLESNAPIGTGSLIEAGSVSKQFTAAAALLAEKKGLLKISDPVRKYVPELPSYDKPILIHHLIHHTSGLHEWSDIAELGGWPQVLNVPDNAAALAIISRQRQLNSEPGTEYRYSNSNYILLAIIVARTSGTSFAHFTRKYIFEPAGMAYTQWRDDFGAVIPNRSRAYDVKNGQFRLFMPNHSIHGSGGLLTTAEELLKWNDFYLADKPGGKAFFDKQTAPDTLADGTLNNYAAGLSVDNRSPGKPVFHHDGATNAYRAKLIASPAEALSIAWLSNTSMLDTTGFDPAAAVFDILTTPADQAAAEVKPASAIRTDPAKLKAYAGFYKSAQSLRDVDITMGPQGLILSETPLEPINDHQFRFYGNKLSFDGKNGLTVIPSGGDPMRYHKVDTTARSTSIDEYAGTYFSEETNAPIHIQKNGNTLEIKLISGETYPLEIYAKDGFLAPGLKADLTFKRNGRKGIGTLELSTQRSLRVTFVKETPRRR